MAARTAASAGPGTETGSAGPPAAGSDPDLSRGGFGRQGPGPGPRPPAPGFRFRSRARPTRPRAPSALTPHPVHVGRHGRRRTKGSGPGAALAVSAASAVTAHPGQRRRCPPARCLRSFRGARAPAHRVARARARARRDVSLRRGCGDSPAASGSPPSGHSASGEQGPPLGSARLLPDRARLLPAVSAAARPPHPGRGAAHLTLPRPSPSPRVPRRPAAPHEGTGR